MSVYPVMRLSAFKLSTSYSIYVAVSTICEVTSSTSLGKMVGQGEVGWYTQRVKITWPCLGLPAKIPQQEWVSLFLIFQVQNGPRKQSSYLVGPP